MQRACDGPGSAATPFMAFRLRSDESVTDGLQRLVRKELKAARDGLRQTSPPSDEAIHEARKSVKKVRAIAQLIDADDGRGLAASSKTLRGVSRTLSALRDADAMVEMLTELRKRNPRLISEHSFARLRRWLAGRKQLAMDAADRDEAWSRVDRRLRKARRAAKRWRPTHPRFGALAAGIRSAHKRGRKTLAIAKDTGRAADFHEWRKEMKALWYALRLIEDCATGIRKGVEQLHSAERFLGDDHNLVVLCAELSQDASVCGGPSDLDRLRLAIDRYQKSLRAQAIAATRRIYALKSGAFLRSVKRAWKPRSDRTTRRTAA